MSHKRTFTTAIIFLIIILIALLVMGPKRLEDTKEIRIISDESIENLEIQKSFSHECECINKNKQELKTYKYYANSEEDARSMCHASICREMFGSEFRALGAKVLNRA